ncbi:MAG: hypothetical protein Q8O67_23185 [Deltaproteobacteria bacterium]|nr:hypothetical protein [Deltaproteobacteria bacterium]
MHLAIPLSIALLGASSGLAAGARVLVVPYAGEGAALVEQGLRAGAVAIPGTEVADAATTAALIEGAKSTGLDCAASAGAAAEDGGCWLRVALLGGLDTVVFANALGVTRASAEGSTTSAPLAPGDAGWASAVRRAFGLESALRVTLSPSSATATVDGTPAPPGVIEGIAPGSHVVAATAPGFQPMSTTVGVAPGAIAEVNLLMVAVEPAVSGLPSTLLWGGVAGVGVGLGVGAAIVGYAQASNNCSTVSCGPPGDPTDDALSKEQQKELAAAQEEGRVNATTVTLIGIGVGAGISVISAAVLASSFFLQ